MRWIVGIMGILVLSSGLAWADGPVVHANCQFQWDAVTKNADGTPITDLRDYRLYLKQVKTNPYDFSKPAVVIPQPTVMSTCQAAGVTKDGQYYAVVTATDLAGNQSLPSNEVAFLRDTVGPEPPPNLSVFDFTMSGTIQLRSVPQSMPPAP